MSRTLLITGGAGFIGSHAVEHWVRHYPQDRLVVLDKMTYAGDAANLDACRGLGQWELVVGDICDAELVQGLFAQYAFDGVMHLAAESHVDRSITNPMEFVRTNVIGTVTLLNAALAAWGEHADRSQRLFYHISTDEVYGSLGAEGLFHETTPYDPRSPYSASKASSDHFVRLPPYLRFARGPHQLLQQLRPSAVPREAHPRGGPRPGRRQAHPRVRGRGQCAGLALCGRSCSGHGCGLSQRAQRRDLQCRR